MTGRYVGARVQRVEDPALPGGPRRLPRRHRAPGDAARRLLPQPVRACADRLDRLRAGARARGRRARRERRGPARPPALHDDDRHAPGAEDGHPAHAPARPGALRRRGRRGRRRELARHRRGRGRADRRLLRARCRPCSTRRRRSRRARQCCTTSSATTTSRTSSSRRATSTRRSPRPRTSSASASTFGRTHAAPLEGRGVIADWDVAEGLGHGLDVDADAVPTCAACSPRSSGCPDTRVRVICPDVGGGFGLKVQLFVEEAIVPELSRRLGAPVKWVEDRYEAHGRERARQGGRLRARASRPTRTGASSR